MGWIYVSKKISLPITVKQFFFFNTELFVLGGLYFPLYLHAKSDPISSAILPVAVVFSHKIVKILGTMPGSGTNTLEEEMTSEMLTMSCQVLRVLPALKDLALAAKFLIGQEGKHLILGLAYNTAEIWDWEHVCRLKSFVCPSDPCMLFAMDFSRRVEEGMVVASGTAFNQVMQRSIASPHIYWIHSLFDFDGFSLLICPVVYLSQNLLNPILLDTQLIIWGLQGAKAQVLGGQEGVIFRIRWIREGKGIVSVSDNRSVRLWEYGDEGLWYLK